LAVEQGDEQHVIDDRSEEGLPIIIIIIIIKNALIRVTLSQKIYRGT